MNIFRRYFWNNLQYNISAFFFPCQRWLTKVIPSKYQDKDALLVLVNQALVIDFVEEEKCFKTIDWSYNRSHAEHAIKSAYHWFKWGRKNVEKHIEELYEIMPTEGFNLELFGGKEVLGTWADWSIDTQELEAKLDNLDKQSIISLAKFKNCLWT